MKKFYDCGIDLGTTNSCIAIPNPDNTCSIIENSTDRMQVTPSVVWINQKGHIVIGQRAYTCPNTADVRKEFKRDMGTETVYEFPSAGVSKTPEELSAEILKSLRRDAVSRIGKEVRDVVVTVPAAFSMVQCEATKKAATMAGFRNVLLLQEPIAASIAYGAKPDAKDQYWLVFDYGGGTLDVSVISTNNGRLDNITSVGNNHKGGKDLDRLLFEKVIVPKLSGDYNLEGGLKNSSRAKLLPFVENCKMELTNAESVDLEVFDVTDNAGELMDGIYEISRAEFEDVIRDEVAEAIEIAKEAMQKSGIPEDKFTKVILVGGTTYVPLVRRMLKEAFSIELDASLNPMTVVAEGAARYAATVTAEDVEAAEAAEEGTLLLDLEYEPMTQEETANVIGKIPGSLGRVARIKVDGVASAASESAIWTSGWVDVLDTDLGIFDVDVHMSALNARNTFRVSAAAEDGSILPLTGNIFEILHQSSALKLSSPPMPYAVGILVTDGLDNRIDWLVAKDTKLPVSVTATYTLTKPLNPKHDDMVKVLIYEGDGVRFTYNPDANYLMRTVHIRSRELTRNLEVGTKVDITIEIDESRCVKVTGYVPSYDYELMAETLGTSEENYVNYGDKMQEVKQKLTETAQTIRHLREEEGLPVDNYEEAFMKVAKDFSKYEAKVGEANDEVHQYLEDFYAFQTDVIMKERESRKDFMTKNNQEEIDMTCERVKRYGTAADKKVLESLLTQYEQGKNQEAKDYLLKKIKDFEGDVLYRSMQFLTDLFYANYGRRNDYLSIGEANTWKRVAMEAIGSNSRDRLLTALQNLERIRPNTAGEAARLNLADLKL